MSPDQVKGLIADLAAKGAEPAAAPVDPPSADPPPLMTGMKLTVRGEGRDQMDAAVMPLLRRPRGSPSAPCTRLQPRQFHADAGNAQDRGAVVANQLAREADQDRRQGREPRPLRHLPDGRGRAAAE